MPAVMPTSQSAPIEANTKRQYFVTRAELPLCCPMPNMVLWNSHPRVYLSIEETGTATCPYCEAEYFLSEASKID